MAAPVTSIPRPAPNPIGQALAAGIMQGYQQGLVRDDMKKISDWVKFNQIMQMSRMDSPPVSEMGPAEGLLPGEAMSVPPELVASVDTGAPSGLTALPKLRSDMGQQLGMSLLRGQLQNLMPLDLMTQSEIAKNQAMAQNYRANALATSNPPPEPQAGPPMILPEGNEYNQPAGTLMQTDRYGKVSFSPPPGGPNPQWQLVEDIETGEQRWNQKGMPLPQGTRAVQTPASVTNVNLQNASATERSALAQGASTMDSLVNMKSLFDEVVSGSGVTAYPGPVMGPLTSLAGVFEKAPAKKEEFRAATLTFKNAMIKAITGAQMSEPEAKRIMGQIPDENDPPTRWLAKWRQSVKNIKDVQSRRQQVLQQSGIRVPSFTGSPQGTTPSQTSARGPVSITTDAEYDALPSGTAFIAPDGSVRRKP